MLFSGAEPFKHFLVEGIMRIIVWNCVEIISKGDVLKYIFLSGAHFPLQIGTVWSKTSSSNIHAYISTPL